MELLKKGHPVLLEVSFTDQENFKEQLARDGIEATEWTENSAFIEGFVAGDDLRRGISVLAVSNEEVCLLSYDNDERGEVSRMREFIRSGRVTIQDIESCRPDDYEQLFQPSCQFK